MPIKLIRSAASFFLTFSSAGAAVILVAAALARPEEQDLNAYIPGCAVVGVIMIPVAFILRTFAIDIWKEVKVPFIVTWTIMALFLLFFAAVFWSLRNWGGPPD